MLLKRKLRFPADKYGEEPEFPDDITGLESGREIDSGGEVRVVPVVCNHCGRIRIEVVYRDIVREETPAVAQNCIVVVLARDGVYGRHVVNYTPVHDVRLHIAQRFGRIRGERVAVDCRGIVAEIDFVAFGGNSRCRTPACRDAAFGQGVFLHRVVGG